MPDELEVKRAAKNTYVKHGAVVVLFQPTAVHLQNVFHLKKLCPSVVAVDNSIVMDAALHSALGSAGVGVVWNKNDGGIAGAFNRGLDALIRKGCDTAFLFDQDSRANHQYFDSMLRACVSIDSELFLLGPKVFDVNVKRYLPAYTVRRFSLRPVPVDETERGMLRCACLISSGTVLNIATYRHVGPFNEAYFIDQVDTEFCFRAACKSVPIYINTSVTLHHELSRREKRKLFGRSVTQWNMAPARQYYSARNCLFVTKTYGTRFPLMALVNLITLQQTISILLFEQRKGQKLLSLFAGLLDGLFDKGGAFDRRWPRLASYSETTSQPAFLERLRGTANV